MVDFSALKSSLGIQMFPDSVIALLKGFSVIILKSHFVSFHILR